MKSSWSIRKVKGRAQGNSKEIMEKFLYNIAILGNFHAWNNIRRPLLIHLLLTGAGVSRRDCALIWWSSQAHPEATHPADSAPWPRLHLHALRGRHGQNGGGQWCLLPQVPQHELPGGSVMWQPCAEQGHVSGWGLGHMTVLRCSIGLCGQVVMGSFISCDLVHIDVMWLNNRAINKGQLLPGQVVLAI